MRRHDGGRPSSGGIVTVLALTAGLLLVACGSSEPKASASKATATTTGTIAVTEPAEGASVGRSFVVKGSGSGFEGTLLWTLTGPSSINGYTTAGVTEPKPFQFTVDAPGAGVYTLVVYRESAKDGAQVDAVRRRVTVR